MKMVKAAAALAMAAAMAAVMGGCLYINLGDGSMALRKIGTSLRESC